jgi:TonB-linked SusC/RagA family outer membrane protein
MKKNLNLVCLLLKQHRKKWIVMRNTILILLISAFQTFAVGSYAQTKTISLAMNNATISEVLSAIQKQSEFYFLYNSELIDVTKKVDVEIEGEKVDEILTRLFNKEEVDFLIKDRYIVLTPVGGNAELFADQQQPAVSGTVTDEAGEPLPGVTVVVKGTTQGTVTNADGNYSLTNVPDDATLQFSFVGMKTHEAEVGNQSTINVTMVIDAIGIEEVVAIGYGTQKKGNITSSIASVSVDDLREQPVTGFDQALAGQVAGVQVQQGSGTPGENPIIRIRGTGSITAGNEPLYVVDGFIGYPDINNINPNDIESINILKDASAAAIYGSRGANGVIIVTTKKGKTGEPRFSANAYYGVQEVAKRFEVLNARQWAELLVEARNNGWMDLGGSPSDPNDIRPSRYQIPPELSDPSKFGEGTDWQDLIFRVAPVQNYDLSISGGTDKMNYYLSGNYYNQKGIIKSSGYKKYSIRLNSEYIIGEKLKAGLNLFPTYSIQDFVRAEQHWAWNGAILGALVMPPVIEPYKENGSYNSAIQNDWGIPSIATPLVALYEEDDKRRKTDLLGNTYLELELVKNLKIKTSFGIKLSNSVRESFRTSLFEGDGRPAPQPPQGSHASAELLNWLSENTLTYNLNIEDDHVFDFLLGYTVQKESFTDSYMSATNFPNDLVQTLNAGVVTEGRTSKYEWSLISYLGRMNYAYKNKYLLNAAIRRDGSSRFGSNSKFGYFPSLSAGWVLSRESFLENSDFIYNLKLRGSIGFTGNNSIPNYGSIGLLETDNYILNNQLVNGISPSTFSNQELGWEKTRQFNIGLDMGLFNNRVYFEADYYNSLTTDLLLNVPVPSVSGYTSALQNIGEVKNSGVEFILNTKNVVGDFKWDTDFNFSANKNEVLALGPAGDPIIKGDNITQIGSPIGSFYGYIFEGIYNTMDEVNSRPHLDSDAPGDPIVKDVNGDGEISSQDRTIIGDNFPDYTFGITNKFGYENFDLNVLIQGVRGYKVFFRQFSWLHMTEGRLNTSIELLERWKSPEDPGNGRIPRADALTDDFRRSATTNSIRDAAFLRIRNITLGYNFSSSSMQKLKISSARMYFSVQNAFTFTNYIGYNPEVSDTEDPLEPGKAFGGYPVPRTYTLGLNINF